VRRDDAERIREDLGRGGDTDLQRGPYWTDDSALQGLPPDRVEVPEPVARDVGLTDDEIAEGGIGHESTIPRSGTGPSGVGPDLPIGWEVCTSDGEVVGRVKEVQSDWLKVDAPMQPDFWLAVDHVQSLSQGRVMLSVTRDRIGHIKSAGPRAA